MKSQLRDLIAQGQLDTALQQLRTATPPDSTLHNDVLVVLNRYQEWRRNKTLGVLEPAQERLIFNQLTAATLDLIGRLPDGAGVNPPAAPASVGAAASSPDASRPWWKSGAAWGLILTAVGVLIAVLSYLNDRGIWPPKEETPATQQPAHDTTSRPVAHPTTTPAGNPAEPKSAPKNQTNITVKDKGKVGTTVTGDSNKIDIKQDF